MSDKSYIPKKKPVKKLETFINLLEESGNISLSAKNSKVSYKTVYYYKENDEAFRMEWETAMERWGDRMEGEAWIRNKSMMKLKPTSAIMGKHTQNGMQE